MLNTLTLTTKEGKTHKTTDMFNKKTNQRLNISRNKKIKKRGEFFSSPFNFYIYFIFQKYSLQIYS